MHCLYYSIFFIKKIISSLLFNRSCFVFGTVYPVSIINIYTMVTRFQYLFIKFKLSYVFHLIQYFSFPYNSIRYLKRNETIRKASITLQFWAKWERFCVSFWNLFVSSFSNQFVATEKRNHMIIVSKSLTLISSTSDILF